MGGTKIQSRELRSCRPGRQIVAPILNNLAGKKREELQEMRDNLDAMLKDHPDTME